MPRESEEHGFWAGVESDELVEPAVKPPAKAAPQVKPVAKPEPAKAEVPVMPPPVRGAVDEAKLLGLPAPSVAKPKTLAEATELYRECFAIHHTTKTRQARANKIAAGRWYFEMQQGNQAPAVNYREVLAIREARIGDCEKEKAELGIV